MKKRLFTTLALVCCSALVCLAVVATGLTGNWAGAIKTPNGDYPLNCSFKVEGDKLSGIAYNETDSIPITDGRINGNSFSFNLTFNGASLKNSGKLYGDSITVDVDFRGTPLHGMLKRVEDK